MQHDWVSIVFNQSGVPRVGYNLLSRAVLAEVAPVPNHGIAALVSLRSVLA